MDLLFRRGKKWYHLTMTLNATDHKRQGQAMLLAVLTLGGTMLGVTTIAGLLMLYQIRQATDFAASAQSLFAADAGTEWALYGFFHGSTDASSTQTLTNNASFSAVCQDDSGNSIACGDANAAQVLSRGTSGNTKRAFQVMLPTAGSAKP
jgi:hypothetical protein